MIWSTEPAGAISLFGTKTVIETETKTNYVACAVSGAVCTTAALAVDLLAGKSG
ncbi:MAG: hypothetical protein LBL71_00600 [Endomicrobium sp.]|jgi:threonine dehydratase|nr:hypothetical protein [Endomicrobium sp.]